MALRIRLIAEFIGTFWLVFGGCGSAIYAAGFPGVGIGLLGVSVAFGLTVVTMAYAIGHIEQLWLFWLAPLAGAVLAGMVYRWSGQAQPQAA